MEKKDEVLYVSTFYWWVFLFFMIAVMGVCKGLEGTRGIWWFGWGWRVWREGEGVGDGGIGDERLVITFVSTKNPSYLVRKAKSSFSKSYNERHIFGV